MSEPRDERDDDLYPTPEETYDDGLGSLAVIGFGLRLPGAADGREYWDNLSQGVDSIRHFSEQELLEAGVAASELAQSNYVRARGVVDGAELFDARFFDFTDREAETLDPQHRIFLEVCWEAMEHAGYDPRAYPGAAGIFAGSNLTSYLIHNLAPNRELVQKVGALQIRIRNDKDFLSTLVAYKLNLKGPAINVQTACSTSLVATSLACQSLLGYQCDLALAGGISITSPPRSGYLYQEGVYALDGVCRAFDAEARGTVLGDGAGVVVLKRLEDALADGDTVHAVIRGFATNNDGSLKLDYTAPSVDGQAEVVGTALALAGWEPEDVSYVETHGTGTPLGDPIEIAALKQAFQGAPAGSCAIGSVKPNIGHLDAAAGVASLIKTVLALEHRQLPPSLHFERPNPRLGLEGSPFTVNDRLRPWTPPGPRRAGVSSFGVGGTNAHVVLEEAPVAPAPAPPRRPWQLLTLSALDETALGQGAERLAAHLKELGEGGIGASGTPGALADVAYTLHVGRRPMPLRRLAVVRDAGDAVAVLRGDVPRRLFAGSAPADGDGSVAFLFPGIGDHYVGMGHGLYRSEEIFRREVDACAEELRPILGLDLRDVLFAETPASSQDGAAAPAVDFRALVRGRAAGEESEAARRLSRTELLHPALFVVELALARLWQSWGIEPAALLGYSIGEYTAACLAGVFSRSDALRLVARRAHIIQRLPEGAMLAVTLPEPEVEERLAAAATTGAAELSIAAVNGPAFTVVAGPEDAVESLRRSLEAAGVQCRRLQAQHAFHSTMMEPALAEFRRVLEGIELHPPELPLVSNVSGTWMTTAEATDPEYWARHLCRTVRFGDGVRELWRDPRRVLLEVGPGQTLGSIAVQNLEPGAEASGVALASLGHGLDAQDDQAVMLTTLGRLWVSGVAVDWQRFHEGEGRRRVPLPTYAFQRRRHWVDAVAPGATPAGSVAAVENQLAKKSDLGRWLYRPGWRRAGLAAAPPAAVEAPAGPTLVYYPAGEEAARILAPILAPILARSLGEAAGSGSLWWAESGESFARTEDSRFTLRPDSVEDWEELLRAMRAAGELPARLVHLGAVTGAASLREPEMEEAQGFYSLLALAQAWGNLCGDAPLELVALSTGLWEVTGDEVLVPRRATLLGPCRVIPQEYPHVAVRAVDLADLDSGAGADIVGWGRLWGRAVAAEIARGAEGERVVALRGRHRWVEDFAPLPAAMPEEGEAGADAVLRRGGVYLVTGGLGGIGLALAERLAERWRARLVLVGRSALPPREHWSAYLEEHPAEDPTSSLLRRLESFEAAGAEVLVLSGDVTDLDSMIAVREAARARFGRIDGVIHAAGRPPGGLIQLKDRAEAAAVLAPKVLGTEVVAQVFGGDELDLLVLCSSLTALTGALGLVDHCAANAFQDAFAHAQQATGLPVLSINWDTWLEVGQAARAGVGERLIALLPAASREPMVHPLLGRPAGSGETSRVYRGALEADHWILREHRLGDHGLIPGTAYLEMIRAALELEMPGETLVLRDVGFTAPCRVPAGEGRELRTTLEREEGTATEWRFRIESSADGERWQLHASGRGAAADASQLEGPPGTDAEHLKAAREEARRLRPRSLDPGLDEAMAQVHFGPRWRDALKELRADGEAGWARLELGEEYHPEASDFGLHPALADSATGLARLLTDGAFLPLGYGTVWIRGRLGTRVESAFRLSGSEDGDTLSAAVQIFSEDGAEVLRIEDYRLRRLSPHEMAGLAAAEATPLARTASRAAGVPGGGPGGSAAVAGFGILPPEGARVFEAILAAAPGEPQIAVSVRDLEAVREQVANLSGSGMRQHLEALRSSEPASTARRSQAPYEAPRNDLEGELTDLFTEMLGGSRVGIHDNFFDLGGNSLVATQLISRLREEMEVEIPLRTLFEAPTVAELAVAIITRQAEEIDSDDLAEALAELRSMTPEEKAALLAGSEGDG